VIDRKEPPKFVAEGRPEHDCFLDGKPIRLRLAPDYTGPGWSALWPDSDYTDALIPPELLTRLVAWSDEFNDKYQYERGWRSEEARDHWAAEAADLVVELQSALEGKAELEVDLWPLRSQTTEPA
jgi:hypothetical protein